MFDIFLTDISTDEHVADLLTVDSAAEANVLCITLQGYLREGIEAHFVSDDEYPDDEAEADQRYAAYLERERAEDA